MSSLGDVRFFFPTLATSRSKSNILRSSRSTLASSPGSTTPSRRYITWLTRGSSALIPQFQMVGYRVTASFESFVQRCYRSPFLTLKIHRRLFSIILQSDTYISNNEVRAIKQIHVFIASMCGSPGWLVQNQDRTKSQSPRPRRFELYKRTQHREVTSVVVPDDNSHSKLQQPCKRTEPAGRSHFFQRAMFFLQGCFFLAGGSEQVPW